MSKPAHKDDHNKAGKGAVIPADLAEARHPTTEELSVFLDDLMEEFRVTMRTGKPELGMNITDPFHSPDFVYGENHPFVSFDVNLTDVLIPGFSNFELKHIGIKHKEHLIFGTFVFNNIIGTGMADIKAKVMGLPWQRRDEFALKAFNVNARVRGGWEPGPDGNYRLTSFNFSTTEDKVELVIGKFIGNAVLNKVFDVKKIYRAYKPNIEQGVEAALKSVLVHAASNFWPKLEVAKRKPRVNEVHLELL